jgi:hypothetical protein
VKPIEVAVEYFACFHNEQRGDESEVLHEEMKKAMQFRYPESSPTPPTLVPIVAINSIAFFRTGAIRNLLVTFVGIKRFACHEYQGREIVLLLFKLLSPQSLTHTHTFFMF